jgi:shikimate dehydrogenase
MNDAPELSPLKAAVIGWPVKHSRSPLIHNHWLAERGIGARYEALPVEPAKLETFLRALPEKGLLGCNITVPHKEEALKYMDSIDPLAAKAGAVNTVIVREGGKLEGRNTDVFGFSENLASAGKAWARKKPALVIGAGGAARAVIVALAEAGCREIRITNRTHDRARDLIRELEPRLKAPLILTGWPDREFAIEDAGLVVNTTTQGMEGQDPLDISLKKLEEGAVVTDLIYAPLLTPLLAEARRRKFATVDGLGMLLYQALPAFEAWFGVRPDVTPELRKKVEASL